MRNRVPLLLTCLVALSACQDQGKGTGTDKVPDKATPVAVKFDFPQDPWHLFPKDDNLSPGTVGPQNGTNGNVHLGNDKTSGKKGDKASTAEKTITCSGEGEFCTVTLRITFAAPKENKDRLKISYWGADKNQAKSVSVKPHSDDDSNKEYKLSVAGACKELHVKVEIDTEDANLSSHADVTISGNPEPTCTATDETNKNEGGGRFDL